MASVVDVSAAKPTPNGSLGTSTAGHTSDSSATKCVIVVLRDDKKLDADLIKFACNMGRSKQIQVTALYCIEVPRSEPLDPHHPVLDVKAQRCLQSAIEVAERFERDIVTEIVRCRSGAHGIVQEANSHDCQMLLMSAPYKEHLDGSCASEQTINYVMEHATCRVMLIRQSKKDAEACLTPCV